MSIMRPAELSDRLELARLRHSLWPEGSLDEALGFEVVDRVVNDRKSL